MKVEFLKNEFWSLSVGAAFQRVNIYHESVGEKARGVFRSDLRIMIDALVLGDYQTKITVNKHLKNIHYISEFTKSQADILHDGFLHFGICQKLLNLYLKYLWCLDLIPAPPHFPVDRQIQKKLGIVNPFPWTKGLDEDEYLSIIELAEEQRKKLSFESLAEYELNLWMN